ncbi:6630_t:CDS:2, partial [Dentiscutata heterogama]
HYNQVIRNDNFIEKLKKNLQFASTINDDYNNFKKQLEKITNQLKECKQQRLLDINLIQELETKNNQLITKNNQLKENEQQRLFYINLIKELETKNNQLITKNNQLIAKNNQLKEIINFNFNNQQIYWLSKYNPVIIEFIKTITYNENETQYTGEKLFKYAI